MHGEIEARREKLVEERGKMSADPTGGLLTCDDPVAAFDAIKDDPPLRVNRIIDYLMTVTISPRHRGERRSNGRKFEYIGIDIKWKEH